MNDSPLAKFTFDQLESASQYYRENGYVVFSDLLSAEEISEILDGYEEAKQQGSINYNLTEFLNNDDSVYQHPAFKKYVYHNKICDIVEVLLDSGAGIELQHCKLNDKPSNADVGTIPWHQDYPYFPHTNYDLLAASVHFDNETLASGPLMVLPGSHKWGPLSHVIDQSFSGAVVDSKEIENCEFVPLLCQSGDVHFHHCFLVHQSSPNVSKIRRRQLIYQYRAEDAVQLAGPLWNCSGMTIRT